ncbi:MAG: hypothetical protein GF355_00715 [Candidatus Eisenbacteria bacterium]|nr:hypothetical protein [Candidatus Eisenbacteria bacterium]
MHMMRGRLGVLSLIFILLAAGGSGGDVETPVPPDQRGTLEAERSGMHDANNLRTVFWNYGMVGDYPDDPGNVDLSVFHSVEVPKGTGMNYSDGITPFVLAQIELADGRTSYIMETGYRERQGISPYHNRVMRFEPRPGYFQADPTINKGRSPAISNDPRTWPDVWPDKLDDPDDPGWAGSWNGYFGKQIVADQETYMVMDDDFYDAWNYFPDTRDSTRNGLGLRIEVRGFQWANPQARNVIFWHYDITNESTTDYEDNIVFGLYMDSGVGGSALSCDGIFESDDDNAFFDRSFNEQIINLVYTWDRYGHGRDLTSSCANTGYLGYAYLETPGNALDQLDNDEDGIVDELRDGGPGELIEGQAAIEQYIDANYDRTRFEISYGLLEDRPPFREGVWWTGDEDMDWVADLHDTGADGVFDTGDNGEGDGQPTAGEPNFDDTDLNESDQIGLTGFKINRIRPGQGNPDQEVDDILFYMDQNEWPRRLYEQFTHPDPAERFDPPLASNYNIGFLFASGPFTLPAGKTERFSLALAYGADLDQLRRTVETVQKIYNANYRFAVPPSLPTASAETGDGYVRLSWDDVAERGADPVTAEFDFEGYRIYRATDPEFRDPQIITTGTGSGPIGNGKPIAQFDLVDGRTGFSEQTVEGVAYYLGTDTGLVHTWTDTTVTNGQRYYYAVTAYDFGSDAFGFYPSENSIAVSRTVRGGIILPPNVVEVRPNPKVPGYVPAQAAGADHVAGDGSGSVDIEVVNSNLVPDDRVFKITFATPAPESLRATTYALVDSTTGEIIFEHGADLQGRGVGAVGSGLLPVIATPRTVQVDTARTGWASDGPTNTLIDARYLDPLSVTINQRRLAYPEDISIVFHDTVVDTSLADFPFPANPAKFQVFAHTDSGDTRLDFRFRDRDEDGTLSDPDERIDIMSYVELVPDDPIPTWGVELDTTGQAERGPIIPPGEGDVFELIVTEPFSDEDVFAFRTTGERVDDAEARAEFADQDPYVVPNPYVASASFEPERFAVSGRGERRIEFRALPAKCTIRIYTIQGALVQTLHHDGSDDGYVAWNLRTKDNLDLAPGLYIFQVDAGSLGEHIGKFAVIK